MATISRSSTPRGTRTRVAQTQVQVEPAPSIRTTEPRPAQVVLHLRGATREEEVESNVAEAGEAGEKSRRRIQWAEDVVDNEGLGRKSSKGALVVPLFEALELFRVDGWGCE
jgi:protein phosphatase 1 regulatory subunit 11